MAIQHLRAIHTHSKAKGRTYEVAKEMALDIGYRGEPTFTGVRALAKRVQCSSRTVVNARKWLVENGEFTIEKIEKQRIYYGFNLPVENVESNTVLDESNTVLDDTVLPRGTRLEQKVTQLEKTVLLLQKTVLLLQKTVLPTVSLFDETVFLFDETVLPRGTQKIEVIEVKKEEEEEEEKRPLPSSSLYGFDPYHWSNFENNGMAGQSEHYKPFLDEIKKHCALPSFEKLQNNLYEMAGTDGFTPNHIKPLAEQFRDRTKDAQVWPKNVLNEFRAQERTRTRERSTTAEKEQSTKTVIYGEMF